jgi:sugar phosphate isomerase/epimerase
MESGNNIAVVVSNDNVGVTAYETIDAIKKAGFKNVFIQWYNENWFPNQEEQLKYIRECGLNIIYAHLGYQFIHNIWLDNEMGEELVDRFKRDIKICKQNNIPLVIMHLTSVREPHINSEIGLKRLKEISIFAKENDVKITFENTKIKGNIDYVLDNIDDENVGMCFDSGHYHVYFDDVLDWEKFKNRIFAIHLHDNDKSADLHLIPFDGTLNWDCVVSNLKECNYNGPITMEFCYRYDYLNMELIDFYKKGYEAGVRLEKMFNND